MKARPWRYVGRDADGVARIAGTVSDRPATRAAAVQYARELLGRWGSLERVDVLAPRGALVESVRRAEHSAHCLACGTEVFGRTPLHAIAEAREHAKVDRRVRDLLGPGPGQDA